MSDLPLPANFSPSPAAGACPGAFPPPPFFFSSAILISEFCRIDEGCLNLHLPRYWISVSAQAVLWVLRTVWPSVRMVNLTAIAKHCREVLLLLQGRKEALEAFQHYRVLVK